MNVINNICDSDFVQQGLCAIVEGSKIFAPASIAGNVLESVTQNEMVQTVAKVLQSTTAAFLTMATTIMVWDFLLDDSFETLMKYSTVINFTAVGLGALVLSMPLICEAGKYLSPENKEKIENFQKSYSAAMKIINIVTASIALGWFGYAAIAAWEISFVITPILLSATSLISSAYALHKHGQLPVAQKTIEN